MRDGKMGLTEALEEIASTAFDVDLNVTSGHDSFTRALTTHPAVKAAGEAAKYSPEAVQQIALKLQELLRVEADPRYEHPSDTAVAACLLLLSQSNPDQAVRCAKLVAVTPMTNNARKGALAIMDAHPGHENSPHEPQASEQDKRPENEGEGPDPSYTFAWVHWTTSDEGYPAPEVLVMRAKDAAQAHAAFAEHQASYGLTWEIYNVECHIGDGPAQLVLEHPEPQEEEDQAGNQTDWN